MSCQELRLGFGVTPYVRLEVTTPSSGQLASRISICVPACDSQGTRLQSIRLCEWSRGNQPPCSGCSEASMRRFVVPAASSMPLSITRSRSQAAESRLPSWGRSSADRPLVGQPILMASYVRQSLGGELSVAGLFEGSSVQSVVVRGHPLEENYGTGGLAGE